MKTYLREDRLGDALKELGDERSAGIGEGTVVEDEEELGAGLEGPDGVSTVVCCSPVYWKLAV